jgi:hypothetical protein
MLLLARRNLLHDRTRFLLSVAGVAVPIGLILLLAGYRSGIYRQASAYLDNTPGGVRGGGNGHRVLREQRNVPRDGPAGPRRPRPDAPVNPTARTTVGHNDPGRSDEPKRRTECLMS